MNDLKIVHIVEKCKRRANIQVSYSKYEKEHAFQTFTQKLIR